jgi:pimeloyl-ACP methyl ester carboxylesterase
MKSIELAYDLEGTGAPIVFLHGLTFDRRTWRPILDRLGDAGQYLSIDLPAHGESGGDPAPLEQVAADVHELVMSMGLDAPVVVGHSMSGAIAFIYASAYPTRAVITVDSGPEVQQFGEIVQQLEPMLRGPGFAQAWTQFEMTLGLDLIPEPVHSLVLETHDVRQDVVLGYWEQLFQTGPAELQAWVDEIIEDIDVPCLGVFGRPLTDGERERFGRLPDVQLEEWEGFGHFVHLVDPDRFAARIRQFVGTVEPALST